MRPETIPSYKCVIGKRSIVKKTIKRYPGLRAVPMKPDMDNGLMNGLDLMYDLIQFLFVCPLRSSVSSSLTMVPNCLLLRWMGLPGRVLCNLLCRVIDLLNVHAFVQEGLLTFGRGRTR